MDISVIPKKTVTVLDPPKPQVADKEKYHQKRVAAYCRVSTDSEEQLTSYTMQKRVYTEMIQKKPEWCLAGIYADEGISGTRADKRVEFQRMIRDCQKGKIDYIITKSVSRFARNTAECIEYVRQLKLLGIGVIFEEQNCDTLKCDSELILTIHAGFAQAESESMSRNITWAVRKRFENGEVMFNYKKMIGYRKGEDGKPEIIPEEAEIIRSIYDMFLSGMTFRQIVDLLLADGVETKCGKRRWSVSTIQGILRNEKYCGDAILQKTVTVDCISKTHKKNTGEAPMYYVSNNHPAIVSKEIFNRTQTELARRLSKRAVSQKNTLTGKGRYSRYALSEVLRCAECGSKYKRVTYHRKVKTQIVWRCTNRLDYGSQYCKTAPTVLESDLHAAIVRAISRYCDTDQEAFHAMMQKSIVNALGLNGQREEAVLLERRIDRLNQQMLKTVEDSIAQGSDISANESVFKALSEEIRQLTERRDALKSNDDEMLEQYEKANEISEKMTELKNCTVEYNDSAVRQMIECISVYADGRLDIIFSGGLTLEERVPIL